MRRLWVCLLTAILSLFGVVVACSLVGFACWLVCLLLVCWFYWCLVFGV